MKRSMTPDQHLFEWRAVVLAGILLVVTPLWGQRTSPEPPTRLEIAGSILIDARYETATWDERAGQFTGVTGTAIYPLEEVPRSKAGPNIYVPMSFENLTIDQASSSLGKVVAGEVVFNAPTLQLDLSGFLFNLESMTITVDETTGTGWLKLPDNIADSGTCGPFSLYLDDLTFPANGGFYQVSPVAPYGIWTLSESGMKIEGTGFVADFSSVWEWDGWAPGSIPPPITWTGLVLLQGQTVSPITAPISNTGYLKAPYAFQYGLIDNDGLNATLGLTAPFYFNPIQPWDYVIGMNEGWLQVIDNKVTDGAFHDGWVRLPWNAVRSNGSYTFCRFYRRGRGLQPQPFGCGDGGERSRLG